MALRTTVPKHKEDLFNRIAERLWRYDPFRTRDLPLDLELLEDGVISVKGYAPTLTIKESILEIVESVQGVAGVEDGVYADPDLEVEIAEEIGRDSSTKHLAAGAVQVFAQLGNVVLVGDLADEERAAVLKVAEGVPGVREVVDRMGGG